MKAVLYPFRSDEPILGLVSDFQQLQWAVAGLVGAPLPPWLASVIAAACSIPTVRLLGGQIAHHIPRDETSAISEDCRSRIAPTNCRLPASRRRFSTG